MEVIMSKRLLFIELASDICKFERQHVQAAAESLQIQTETIPYHNAADLTAQIKQKASNGSKFDYLYVAAHGDATGIGDSAGGIDLSWFDLGVAICEEDALADDSTLFLACCHGGIQWGAYDLFAACEQLTCICGPEYSLCPKSLTVASHLFLYYVEQMGIPPKNAAMRVSKAIDREFFAHDFETVRRDPQFQAWLSQYEAIGS
jgi:hypothetical protein